MTTQNIYNLGFSKCGTSSIWQFFSGFPPTQGKCFRAARGAIEFDLRRDLQEDHKELLKEGGCFLKFSGAAFGANSIQSFHNIACSYGDPLYILSVRGSAQVLRSWFNMHKKIAREGIAVDHFAVKEREKYLNISFDQYFHEFIDKVYYSSLIHTFAQRVYPCPVYILDFRRVHLGVSGVMGAFLEKYFPGVDYANTFPLINKGIYEKSDIFDVSEEMVRRTDLIDAEFDSLLSNVDAIGANCFIGHHCDC